jgi:predicted Zn-dependent peptidase/predicted Ser/Thr protein kinase
LAPVSKPGDDAEQPTVASSHSPVDTLVLEQTASLSTEAREGLAALAAQPAPDPEQIGRFRVVGRLGAGGMGVVYAAHDDELDRDVAIKLLRSNLSADLSGRERLLREAQAIARLSHPNIVHVYEVGQDRGRVFMAMELVRGVTLREFCKGKPWREVIEVFVGAGEGLAAAHAQLLVHRDFKPDNVIVDGRGRARVVDFGLARAPTSTHDGDGDPTGELAGPVATPTTGRRPLSAELTGAGTVVGTPAYMAPEQLAKADPDARTDQFAFCVSLFEMLYDRRPFKGSTYTAVARAVLTGFDVPDEPGPRGVPRPVRKVLLRGMARAPEARFATMDELLLALRKAAAPVQWRTIAVVASAAVAGAIAVQVGTKSPVAETPADTRTSTGTDVAAETDPWASIVAASDLPTTLAEPLADDPTKVTVHRLRNGLTVYVAPRPMEPQLSITLAVRAGSEQERSFGPGLAYSLLNAVFRGSADTGVRMPAAEQPSLVMQHRALESLAGADDPASRTALFHIANAAEHAAVGMVLRNDVDDGVVALGGDFSASRSGSGTWFRVAVPALRVDAGLGLVAPAIRAPAFRNYLGQIREQLDYYVELTTNDRAWQVSQQELAAATGLREDYESATAYMRDVPLGAARKLHDTYYRPNNAAVVFVGDITVARALELAERHFGSWAPAPIPVLEPLDRPLPGGEVRREVEDGGAASVYVSWPLPPAHTPEYAAFVDLADALSRPDGLGSLLRATTSSASWSLSSYRSLDLRVTPRPGQTLAQAEAEIDRTLKTIADGELAEEVWDAALRRAELARLDWARRSENLAETITKTFIDHRQWSDVAPRLVGTPTRDELAAAARALAGRSRVVVVRKPGKTWHLPFVELPGEPPVLSQGGLSPRARAIIDTPVVPPEPQFLVAGSHYAVRRRDGGRFISVEVDSPIAFASWAYPGGVDADPAACDAVRARVSSVRIAGMDFDAYCTNDMFWVDIVAPADRFVDEAALAFAWLDHGMPSDSELQRYVERALQSRAARRTNAVFRDDAFHEWALRGEHAIGARGLADAELERGGARGLAESLARVDTRTADVLYVGPHAERIADALPAPHGPAAPPRRPPAVRTPARDTIYILDDPGREDVDVRVSVPWPELDPRTALAASVHDLAVIRRATEAPPSLDHRWVSTPWWSTQRPLAFDVGYHGAPADVMLAIDTGLAVLRREVGAPELDAGRRELEIEFRAARTHARRIPEIVRLWPSKTDPRVAQWLALPSLESADLGRFYATFSRTPVIVSIVGDVARMDLDALAERGDVVRVALDRMSEILRDSGPP